VGMVCDFAPQTVSVNAKLSIESMPELIAYAKASPDKLTMAFDSTTGAGAFAAKLLNKRANLGLIEVPYRAVSQMVQDVAGGTAQLMVGSIAATQSVVASGLVRRIAVTSESRFPGLPDLPTVAEAVPGVAINGFFAVVAPTGTPTDVLQKISHEMGEYLKGADIKKRFLDFGVSTDGAGTPESTAQVIREAQEKWRALGQELHIEPQ
jgi:tripartite-type tricarboxylate transporter receptor subunit TctC